MVTETQIRDRVAALLGREMSLDEFEEWFAQATWDMHLDSDERSQALASTIGLLLAEYSNGHLTEEELLRELAPVVEDYTVRVSFGGEAEPSWSGASTCSQNVFGPIL